MINKVKCKHYDEENGWCKKLSDWSDPMPHIVYCPKSPCEHAEPIEQPMNDNDIIKALGYCFAVGDCEHCVYADKPCQELMADALDLINRQKAEIERLNHIRAELSKEIDKLREVNNDLNYQVDAWNPTQTIKDFAVRLKGIDLYRYVEEHYKNAELYVEVRQDRFCKDIDDLVEEMTEEKE